MVVVLLAPTLVKTILNVTIVLILWEVSFLEEDTSKPV